MVAIYDTFEGRVENDSIHFIVYYTTLIGSILDSRLRVLMVISFEKVISNQRHDITGQMSLMDTSSYAKTRSLMFVSH